jgi:hypothetical protein
MPAEVEQEVQAEPIHKRGQVACFAPKKLVIYCNNVAALTRHVNSLFDKI